MAEKKRTSQKSAIQPPCKAPFVRSDAVTFEDGAGLRQRAEEMMLKQSGLIDKIPPSDVQRIVHELHVHQIELEMQNEELRNKQQALELYREKYFDLFDMAPVGYLSLNEEGIILETNRHTAALLGVSKSNLVGQSLSRFIYGEDQDRYYLCRRSLVERAAKQECEIRMVRNDGTILWVRIDIITAQGINGAKNIRAVIIDINERQKSQDALVCAKEEWELTFDSVPDLIAIIDTRYRIRRVNKAMADRLGRVAGECVGMLCHEVVHGLSTHLESCPIARTFRDGLPHSEEIYEGRLGGDFVVSSTPLRNESGQMIGTVHVAHDITRRKHAEEMLKESEAMFKSFAENAIVGVYLIQDGVFKYVNPLFAEMHGYTVNECLDEKFMAAAAYPDDMPLIRKNIERRLSGEIPNVHYEVRAIKKTGEIINVEVFGSIGTYKQRPAIIGTMLDISKRKQSEEELRIAHNELENRVKERTKELLQVNEALEVLVADLRRSRETIFVHEKHLKALVKDLSLTEERERRRIANALHENIGQILALIKIELGALAESTHSAETYEEIGQIRDLIDQVSQFVRTLTADICPPILYEIGFYAAVQRLAGQFQGKYNIKFDFFSDGEEEPIDDEMRSLLFNVVRELLVNIVKHAKAERATISLLGDANEINITVADNGIGFDTTENRPEGSNEGFGILNISERLSSIGGRIEIKSAINAGTTVLVKVPRC
ncbi:MAG: PAS domain S-box protein [Dissulfurispiraceae bacterium]